MPIRHTAAAILLLAPAATTSAHLTDVFSTTFISADASIEIAGVGDVAEQIADPFILDQLGMIDVDRSLTAQIPAGQSSVAIAAAGTFVAAGPRIELGFDASVSAHVNPDEPDAFAFVKARVVNITRFTSSLPVTINVSGLAARDFDLFGSTEPLLNQTLILINDEFDPDATPYVLENPMGAVNETITLGPGSYQFQLAVDATFQLFGFPDGDYFAASSLAATAEIIAVPAPAAAALLAAPLLLRRRR